MFDFRRITQFCLEKRLSKHKMTTFSKNLGGGMAPLPPFGYAHDYHIFYFQPCTDTYISEYYFQTLLYAYC